MQVEDQVQYERNYSCLPYLAENILELQKQRHSQKMTKNGAKQEEKNCMQKKEKHFQMLTFRVNFTDIMY